MSTNQEIALLQIKGIEQVLKSAFPQIKSVVSNGISPEKMARVVVNELSSNSYLRGIAAQNPNSLIRSVMQSSQLGLEVGGHLGQAYLVPFKGEINLIVGYRGLLSLARRSGEITSINAEIVYEKDEFDLSLGLEPKVIHKPFLKGERGDPVIVYMSAHFKDGGHHFEWMTIDDVHKIRDNSQGYQAAVRNKKPTPWETNYEEMVRKTVIRRGWKYLPMSVEMQNAQVIENAIDSGKKTESIDGSYVIIDDGDNDVQQSSEPTQQQQQPTSSVMSMVEFEKKKDGFKKAIQGGRQTVNGLIEQLTNLGQLLTDDQMMELASYQSTPVQQGLMVDNETGEIK